MKFLKAGDILIATPNDVDSGLASSFLQDSGFRVRTFSSLTELCAALTDAVGCIIVVEEALTTPELNRFQSALAVQPEWSDIPVIMIASHERALETYRQRVFPDAGNITLLQRPLSPVSLASAAYVALRSRTHQFKIRDLLQQRGEALRRRDEFLAMLAHELRNPLTPIRNAVYLLKSLKWDDPIFTKARTLIANQVAHIVRLVDDLLDVSRLEMGKIDLRMEPLDLDAKVAAAAEAASNMLAARSQNLRLELSDKVLCINADTVRLEQVISNLIGNASKFTPAGGTITLGTRQAGGQACLTVEDTGIGIKPEMQEAIFELFRQDDNSLARTTGGLGIGLTVARRLVELHGGTIRAESDGAGKGSRFIICLPLVESTALAKAETPSTGTKAATRRVLVVEDNPEIRESMIMLLKLWNHEVSVADNGNSGLQRAADFQPDIAFIDIGLPELDGYGVARRIRSLDQPWAKSVKLIALTGYGQTNDRKMAFQAGFDQHLLKPVDPADMEAILAGSHSS